MLICQTSLLLIVTGFWEKAKNIVYDVQPTTPLINRHEGNCIEGDTAGAPVTDPPFTQLLFTFGCDTTLDECGN